MATVNDAGVVSLRHIGGGRFRPADAESSAAINVAGWFPDGHTEAGAYYEEGPKLRDIHAELESDGHAVRYLYGAASYPAPLAGYDMAEVVADRLGLPRGSVYTTDADLFANDARHSDPGHEAEAACLAFVDADESLRHAESVRQAAAARMDRALKRAAKAGHAVIFPVVAGGHVISRVGGRGPRYHAQRCTVVPEPAPRQLTFGGLEVGARFRTEAGYTTWTKCGEAEATGMGGDRFPFTPDVPVTLCPAS